MSSRSRTLTTGLALSTLFFVACGDGRASQEGDLGNLTFTFPVADGQEDFDRPIALGARLRLRVEPREGEEGSIQRIDAATVDPATVIAAQRSQVRPDELILTAREQGSATVTVEATLSGSQSRTDRVDFRVRPVSSISLEHQCTQSGAAAYLTNQPITLGFARFDADRRRMIGEGACDVEVTPDADIDRTRCDEATLEVPPISEPGPYIVGSTRSPRNGSTLNRLDLNIVDPDLLDFDAPEGSLEEGRSREVELLPRTPDWDVCTPLEFQVLILTPDVCRGDDTRNDRFTVFRDEDNRVDLRGLRAGTCEFEVTLPALGVQDAWLFTIPVHWDD